MNSHLGTTLLKSIILSFITFICSNCIAQSTSDSSKLKLIHTYHTENGLFAVKPELKETSKKRQLTDAGGKAIAKIDADQNCIFTSPKHNFYVSNRCGENADDTLYFFSINGKLINKSIITNDCMFTFSANGKYLLCWQNGPIIIFIYNSEGELISSFNYTKLHNEAIIKSIFIDPGGKNLLISGTNKISYCTVTGDIIWQQEPQWVHDVSFGQNNLIVSTSSNNHHDSPRDIKLLSTNNGKIEYAFTGIEKVYSISPELIFKKDEKIYHYKVQ